jgi:transportin-3
MSGITMQNLLEALHALYSIPVPENYKQIDRWLNKFQRSSEAWSIIDSVFSTPNLPEHVNSIQAYFFAAQTLKTKLSFDFEEIKRLDLASFRLNLLNLLHRYSQVLSIKSEIVARQLCLGLAIFALHMTEEWGDSMIQDLQNSLSGFPALFLEVLKVNDRLVPC